MRILFWTLPAIVILGTLGFLVFQRLAVDAGAAAPGGPQKAAPIPVEVVPIALGEMRDTAFFTGTLESPRHFGVSGKIAGRLVELHKDVGDPVRRGDLVAVLDDDEYTQAIVQAEATLEVQRATQILAAAELAAAERDFRREENLHKQGVSSEVEFDRAEVALKARQAQLAVAASQVARSQSELELARTRHAYTRVLADWTEGEDVRYVAERTASVGDTLRAHDPICSVIDLETLNAVIHVVERDYAKLRVGAPVLLTTDAYPGKSFLGTVKRIPPLLREASREARVEVAVPNEDHALRPGMFVRAVIEFDRKENALVVPFNAITRHNGLEGIFVAEPRPAAEGERAGGWRARFVPVLTGYRERREERIGAGDAVAGRVELVEPAALSGLVVTLGQRLLSDGSPIVFDPAVAAKVAADAPGAAAPADGDREHG